MYYSFHINVISNNFIISLQLNLYICIWFFNNQNEKIYGNNDVIGPDSSHGTHVSGIIAAVTNFIALNNPVATDLRFALALLKINYNLERIGDQAFDIANYTIDLNQKLAPELVEKLQFKVMFETLESMFKDIVTAYTDENLKAARKVFKKDKVINQINANTFLIVEEEVVKNPALVKQYLMALVVMKKYEKIGDLLKNISESIIYYIDAKILKHKKKK